MQQAVSKRAIDICWAVVILSVEIVEAVPTKLKFALCTLHEFTTTISNDAYLTSWTNFSTEDFVRVAEQSELPEVKSFEISQ